MNGTEDNELAADSSVAGLDWSWDQHAVCVLDEDGTVLERFDVSHDAAGLREVVRRLARRRVRGVGIERGDGPVVDALLAAGLSVFVMHLIGDIPSPPLIGYLSDRSSLDRAFLIVPLAVVIAGVVWTIAARLRDA